MTDQLSDLGDRIGESLPRAIGLAPTSRGRDRDTTGSSLGNDYTVVLSPTLHDSFFARFEHLIGEPDLEGTPLFSPATASSDLSLDQYRTHATLQAFAIAARGFLATFGLVPWAQIVREIAGRVRGNPPSFRAQAPAASSHLGVLRRRLLSCTDVSPAFAARLKRHRPFIVIANQLLIEMRKEWDFSREATNNDIASVNLLPEPWFERIVRTICTEFADESDEVEKAENHKFCADLAAARSPIRGTGDLSAFAVSAPSRDRLKVSLDTGSPFLMEISPGNVVLWPAAVVSVEADTSMLFGPRTDLTVRLSSCTGAYGRTPGSRSTEASSLACLVSPLALHPFASGEMALCLGSTRQRNRQLGQPESLADVVLECHLRSGVRVYRYGWRESNRNRVYHDLRGDPAGLNVIPLAEALKHVATHPEMELVRWQR